MKIHEILSKQVADVKSGVISAINNFLIADNDEKITLHTPFIYGIEDDGQLIVGYNVKTQLVLIEKQTEDCEIPISDLGIEDLLFILEQVEYEIYSVEE